MSDTAKVANPGNHGTIVAEAARSGEPDRYLAALLAPPDQRDALVALAAFSAELSRIPDRAVREPAMGEIRLQWWRDALELPTPLSAGHPVADAIRNAARDHELPAGLLETLVDGRLPLLDSQSPLSPDGQDDLLWKTEGALFALSARVVGLREGADIEAGCAAAGQAYGLTRLLFELPQALARGNIPVSAAQLEVAGLPAEDLLSGVADDRIERLLEACSAQISRNLHTAQQFTLVLPRSARVAFLPLALVPSYLRSLQRSGRTLLRTEARLAPLTRVCRIAAAHLLGRW